MAVAVKGTSFHTSVKLLPLLSAETTGVCMPIGKTEMLPAAVYKSPQRIWSDRDVTEL
jgi:hypothetical protein